MEYVVLNSGGPVMKVVGGSVSGKGGRLSCEWTDDDGSIQHGEFDPLCLTESAPK